MESLDELHGCESHFAKPYLQNLDLFAKHYERFKKELEREPHARRHPLMNLVGFLAAKIKKSREAICYFEDVLKEDANNINALLNLISCYQRLKDQLKVKKYKDELIRICGDERLTAACKARASYEHAEAMTAIEAFKQEQVGHELVKNCYQKVLETDENELVRDYERKEWNFGYGFLCLRLDSLYGSENCTEYFEESVNHFYKIAISECNPVDENLDPKSFEALMQKRLLDMVPKAWCFMAALLSRQKRDQIKLVEVVKGDVLDDHQNFTLVECIQTAIELSSSDDKGCRPVILRRAGQVYMALGQMELAKKFLDGARKLHDCDYADELLGRWYLKMHKNHGSSQEDFLSEAAECFQKAIDLKTDLWFCYTHLLEVYELRGDLSSDEALHICYACEERGGCYDHKLYTMWAKCLEARGDLEGAEKMHKKAEEVKIGYYGEKRHFGAIYCDVDAERVSVIVSELESKCDARGWFINRQEDVQYGWDIVDAWTDLGKKCQFVLVFVSKRFLTLKTSLPFQVLKTVVLERGEQAADEASKDTIIPVLLDGNKQLPDCIKTKRAVPFEDSETFYNSFRKLFHSDTLAGAR